MRRIKRAVAALVMICMLCPCISMVAHAASAELRFTDPPTTVGAEVEVTARLSSTSNLQSLEATLTYDASMLKFRSGDNATGGDGTITLSGSGSGTEMVFVLTFQALEEGTAQIQVSEASGTDASGSSLQITRGSSKVEIGPGDPSLITDDEGGDTAGAVTADGAQVEVDGSPYVISGGFSDAVIPEGFVRGQVTFEGNACEVITQEASGESAMYLTPAAGGDPDFFMYNSDKGTFSPFEEVELAQDRYIVLLRNDGSVKVPKNFQETTLTLNGKEFTAWQNTENADYYMVYALNADGQKALYMYDTVDKTYQRYTKTEAASADDSKKASPKGLWGKILQFFEDFLDVAVILIAAVLLILIVVVIVIAVKLRHRNLELDDLYDEYGIDLDDEEEQFPAGGKKADHKSAGKKMAAAKGKPAVRTPVETTTINLDDEDDFEAFDDYDEEFDDLSDDFDDYEDDDYEEGFDYDDEPEEMIDDLDDLLSDQSSSRRGHMEPDDTFKVDFIDID